MTPPARRLRHPRSSAARRPRHPRSSAARRPRPPDRSPTASACAWRVWGSTCRSRRGIVERDVDQQRTPEGYAFHLPGTAIPGRRGNTYLYSHARTGMFLSLWEARVGDEVVIVTPDAGTLVYVVAEVRPRVAPTDISVAQPTAEERLTLQTSTGPAPPDPRFVVIALPR